MVALAGLCWPFFDAAAQLAPQVTPRDLRPEVKQAPPAALPQQAPAQVPANADALFVQLSDVTVEGGFAGMTAATEALIAPLRGRRIAVADFYALADAIEALYQAQGFALVRVAVPPQAVKDGEVLRLVVVDGFIERVDTSSLNPRARRQVDAMLRTLVGRRQLRSADLERALTLAGRSPGVQLRSTLKPGSATGAVVLVLDGAFSLISGSASADNRLAPALGPKQTNLQVSLQQPFGFGEQVYVYASSGADSRTAYRDSARRRVAGVGVQLPLGTNGLVLNPEITSSDSKPQPLPFTPFTRSRFDRLTLRLAYPLVLNREQELTLTASFDASNQLDTLPDFAYTLDDERSRVFRLAANWRRPWVRDSNLSLVATLSKGVTRLGARGVDDVLSSGIPLSRPGINPAFAKFEAAVVLDTSPANLLQGRTSLRTQQVLSHGAVPGSELFSLDGEDAVSTLSSGAMSDDAGWTLRQELSKALRFDLDAPLGLQPYAFAAIGGHHSRIDGAPGGRIRAYGAGLRTQWRSASLALEYGHLLHESTTPNSDRLLAKVQVQF